MTSLQHLLLPTLRLRAPPPCSTAAAASYLRFYSVAQDLSRVKNDPNAIATTKASLNDVRTEALRNLGHDLYPRFVPDTTAKTWSTRSFLDRFISLAHNETPDIPQAALAGMLNDNYLGASAHIGRKGQLCAHVKLFPRLHRLSS